MEPKTIVKYRIDYQGNIHTEVLDGETGEVLSDEVEENKYDPDDQWCKEHGV